MLTRKANATATVPVAKKATGASTKKAVKAKTTTTATTATKRKRTGDEAETAPTLLNGVSKRAKTPLGLARGKTPTVADADKENAVPTAVNGGYRTTRVKSVTPAPAEASKAKVTAAAKRKAAEDDYKKDTTETQAVVATRDVTPLAKKRVTAAPKRIAKIGVKINDAPTKPLNVFVFGEGSSGELGLGSVHVDGKKPIDVKRPRLNMNLAAATVGVVQVVAGGMHAVALTRDNKILTWGVNDQGALGRDTTWEGRLRDADADDSADDSDDDDDDSGLNPRESTPGEIDTSGVAMDTKFVQVVACDSASFALTEDGRIYGWGTFRASDGILGFSRDVDIQRTPVLLPEPKKVRALATGSNHIMALDVKGKLFTWGCPEQNQLGRRCVQRDIKESALRPGGIGFRRGVHVEKIACGSYHSFALDTKGHVYAWGLNNFGQLNVEQGAGDTDATVLDATRIEGLVAHRIVDIDGGEHHSLACTADGKLLTWGRIDGHQVGLPKGSFTEENAIFDEHGKPRILKEPTEVPGVPPTVALVSAGTDNSFALTSNGKAYSWGFSANYQTGQGTTDDIETPTLIDNTAVRDTKLVYASAGGQFSILASVAE